MPESKVWPNWLLANTNRQPPQHVGAVVGVVDEVTEHDRKVWRRIDRGDLVAGLDQALPGREQGLVVARVARADHVGISDHDHAEAVRLAVAGIAVAWIAVAGSSVREPLSSSSVMSRPTEFNMPRAC